MTADRYISGLLSVTPRHRSAGKLHGPIPLRRAGSTPLTNDSSTARLMFWLRRHSKRLQRGGAVAPPLRAVNQTDNVHHAFRSRSGAVETFVNQSQ